MPLRNRQLGALGDGHHEYLVWRGQFDARQLHCIGWSRATGKYSTWGSWFLAGLERDCTAMLIFVLLSVFIAGLMVGRTPEYLGKKIESREVKLAMLYVLIFPLIILYFSGWSAVAPYALSSLNNAGPHGLSEILYLYSSQAGNNGSAFAGINGNTSVV